MLRRILFPKSRHLALLTHSPELGRGSRLKSLGTKNVQACERSGPSQHSKMLRTPSLSKICPYKCFSDQIRSKNVQELKTLSGNYRVFLQCWDNFLQFWVLLMGTTTTIWHANLAEWIFVSKPLLTIFLFLGTDHFLTPLVCMIKVCLRMKHWPADMLGSSSMSLGIFILLCRMVTLLLDTLLAQLTSITSASSAEKNIFKEVPPSFGDGPFESVRIVATCTQLSPQIHAPSLWTFPVATLAPRGWALTSSFYFKGGSQENNLYSHVCSALVCCPCSHALEVNLWRLWKQSRMTVLVTSR